MHANKILFLDIQQKFSKVQSMAILLVSNATIPNPSQENLYAPTIHCPFSLSACKGVHAYQ